MSPSVKSLCLLGAALLLTSAAPTRSPWVGRWFDVAEESRRSPVSFTLAALPGGRCGSTMAQKPTFSRPAARRRPSFCNPQFSVRTGVPTPTELRYVKIIGGHPIQRVEQRLSQDGTRLVARRTSIGQDGQERGHEKGDPASRSARALTAKGEAIVDR